MLCSLGVVVLMEVFCIVEHVSVCCNLRHKDLYDVITETLKVACGDGNIII